MTHNDNNLTAFSVPQLCCSTYDNVSFLYLFVFDWILNRHSGEHRRHCGHLHSNYNVQVQFNIWSRKLWCIYQAKLGVHKKGHYLTPAKCQTQVVSAMFRCRWGHTAVCLCQSLTHGNTHMDLVYSGAPKLWNLYHFLDFSFFLLKYIGLLTERNNRFFFVWNV